MVAAVVQSNRIAIEELCRRFEVARLEVVGSAADDTFNPRRSDIDFLVDFLPLPRGTMFDTYFGLLESLEALFGRKIDLVDATCLTNPYFIAGVHASRRTVFETEDAEKTSAVGTARN